MRDFRRKLLLILVGLLLPVLLLALVEGTLALFGIGDDALYDDPFVGFAPGSRLFEEREVGGEGRWVTRPAKLAFFNEQSFPVAKGAGTVRIFTLGGSTTAGRPYDDLLSFSQWLRLYLQAADPHRHFEVVNAGAISYASDRIALLMQELVRYEPDAFVIYTGHNEFLEERTYSELIHQSEAVKRLRMWVSNFRFAALARRAMAPSPQRGTETDQLVTRLDAWTGLERFHRDPHLEDTVVEHFASNLRRMIGIARGGGVRVVFVQPISNLKDFSPFKGEPGRSLSGAEQGRLETLQGRAEELLGAGRPAEALASLKEALELAPQHADLHFLVGRCHLAVGRFEEARAAFVLSKDLDAAPLRALERIERQIEQVTARERAALVDLPAAREGENRRLTGHGIFGNELLQDHVHPTVKVHARIAELLVEELAAMGLVSPGAGWTAEARQQIQRRHMATLDPRYYAQRDLNLGKVLGWAGKLREAEAPLRRAAAVLPEEPDVWINLGILLQRIGRPEESVETLQRAAELRPSSPLVLFNLGVSYGASGRPREAVAAFRRAVELQPDYPEAWYNLGELEARSDDLAAAEQSLQRSRELAPERLEVYLALARVQISGGRLDEASSSLSRALELAPSDAEVYYHRGLLAARQGRGEEAAAAYRRAVELNPVHTRALNNLGILEAGSGDLQEASTLLVRAIEADPGYAEAYANLGVVYDNAGRPREAIRVLEKAVELAPETPRFGLALGLVHAALGELDQARPYLKAARAAFR